MKQFFFVLLLVLFAVLALYRPVYSMPEIYSFTEDFEKVTWFGPGNNTHTISNDRSHSGTHSSKVDAIMAYSYICQVNAEYIEAHELKIVKVKAKVVAPVETKGLFIVCQAQKAGQAPFFWNSSEVLINSDEWLSVEAEFVVNRSLAPEDQISVYLWNTSSATAYIDDIEVSYY
jgi:hypothetical protein